MFKANKKHLQPEMFSTVNTLPQKLRDLLASSWADTFYREVFCRIDETGFSMLYSVPPQTKIIFAGKPLRALLDKPVWMKNFVDVFMEQ